MTQTATTTLVIFSLSLTLSGPVAADAQGSGVVKKENLKIATSDGVQLAADLYLPRDKGRYPTLLLRTPYDKQQLSFMAEFMASNGYAVLIQDVRGKYGSDGQLDLKHEKKDGLETLDWITRQGWSNGGVGFWGPSYLAYCGMLMATQNHPALKTGINWASFGDVYGLLYNNGSFNHMFTSAWAIRYDCRRHRSLRGVDFEKLFQVVPLNDLPKSIPDYRGKIWDTVTGQQTYGPYYRNVSYDHLYQKIKIPILHITGWNDWMHPQTIKAYLGMKGTNKHQKLLIGSWTHDQDLNGGTKFGDEDFGPEAEMGSEKMFRLALAWFDHHLKGDENAIAGMPDVRYFLMGRNEWMTSDTFPPRNVEAQRWYLASDGRANTAEGDGRLQIRPPSGSGAEYDSYLYDPQNPVPTTGGINVHMFHRYIGIRDQRSVEQRGDVLVYTSQPLTRALDIVGEAKMKLFVSSNSVDTDYTAKLVEVRKSGYARNISDGITKTRFRNSFKRAEKIEPNKRYELAIPLGATAISIPKGHRLRLEISSSNFPKYPRNPNTGVSEIDARVFRKAKQRVYHSKRYASVLILPVIQAEGD